MGLKGMMVLVLVAFFLILSYGRAEGGRVTVREDLELHRYVKRLNERAVKIVKTPEGDVINCVDINKQPALDHPLSKNHTIQMYPSSFPKGMTRNNSSTTNISSTTTKDLGCPKGTVPILRIQKEDLRRLKSMPKRVGPNGSNPPGYHFAVTKTEKNPNRKYHGSKVAMAVYGPSVSSDQFTEGVMWVQNGPLDQINSIQVGWTVNPSLYGDNRTHLFGYWTADGYKKTGCFDILCAGFIQLSSETTLGLILSPVSHGDVHYETEFHVFKDPKTGNWWLGISPRDTLVGYWPNYLFTSMTTHADDIEWGGEVYSPRDENHPAMGSGIFVKRNAKKTNYVRRIEIVDDYDKLVEPGKIPMQIVADNPDCYNSEYDGYIDGYMRYTSVFGGPLGLNCGI